MSSVKQTVTLLHRALLLLLKDSLNFSSRLQVVGAVCITVDDDNNDLVIKFNDILQRDEANAPINLAQHTPGGAQRAVDVPNGQLSTVGKFPSTQAQAVGTQNTKNTKNTKRKGGKASKLTILKRVSAPIEALNNEVEEVDTKPQIEPMSSHSEASSVNDPSYTAGGKKRKASSAGSNARTLASATTATAASAAAAAQGKTPTPGIKRRVASNGSSDGKSVRVSGGNGVDIKNVRQNWPPASARKRVPCECLVCGLVFCSRAVLERHALRHYGVRPYECTVCAERFYRKDQALTHVKKTHERSTPAEEFVAERVGKTESRQLIEQLASANASAADDERSVGVGGLPTFVNAGPPNDDDEIDDAEVRNDDELEDDEDGADERNSPGPPNASTESLSSLIQRKCMRSELRSHSVGVPVPGRVGVRSALGHLGNEDDDDERARAAGAEDDMDNDEDGAMLRHHVDEALFGGATMPIDNEDDDDDAPVSNDG